MLSRFFIVILVSLLWIHSDLFAQSVIDGVLIQADSTEGFTETDEFVLKGNVQVAFQGQTLRCDEAHINLKTKTVEARGNVILNDAQIHLEADMVRLNYQTNTGVIENGFIQSGQLIIEGKRIHKTGDLVYVAEEAEFTSCATCPPGWSFYGKEVEAELGGYAKISWPVFKIANWSLLPLPWLMVPLKTERQSGLLVPSYEYTQRGRFALNQNYFWAISRSQDATIGLTYHELLGLKWASEYRYILSPDSKGHLRGAYLEDRIFSQDFLNGSNFGRWYLKYNHIFDLPDGFVQRVEVTDVSDLLYARDFPNDLQEWGDPALENRVSITKNQDNLHLSAEASIYKNLLNASAPLAKNSDAVHKIPELMVRTSDISFWDYGPTIRFDLNSTHFVRDTFSYDDLRLDAGNLREPLPAPGIPGEFVRDGSFDPATDLMRTGHRLDAQALIQAPFQAGRILQFSPSLMFREMQYQFEIDQDTSTQGFAPSAAQRYIQTDLTARTEMSYVFGNENEFANKYKHSLIPEVGYSHIPWIRRPDHPFFGDYRGQPFLRRDEPISDQDVNGINRLQFDYEDRIFDRELITLALTNRIVRKDFVGGDPYYHNLIFFQLSQNYDLNESRTDKPQPWSSVRGLLNVDTKYISADSTTSYNPYAKITNTATRLQIKPLEAYYFQISYSQNTLVNEDNEVRAETRTENIGLGVGLVSTYWDLVANLDYSRVTGQLQSWDYITRIKPPGNCWYIELMHRQILGGDVNLKANVSFNFGGN